MTSTARTQCHVRNALESTRISHSGFNDMLDLNPLHPGRSLPFPTRNPACMATLAAPSSTRCEPTQRASCLGNGLQVSSTLHQTSPAVVRCAVAESNQNVLPCQRVVRVIWVRVLKVPFLSTSSLLACFAGAGAFDVPGNLQVILFTSWSSPFNFYSSHKRQIHLLEIESAETP
jgi:hypothetical protein